MSISDNIHRSIDNGNVSALVSLDFSKAFDTVNHELLLAKLSYCGLSTSVIALSSGNGLHLNPSKTSLMLVNSRHNLSRTNLLTIFLEFTPILPSTAQRILGLHVDPLWTFEHHVTVKCRAAYIRLRKLYPLRHILSISQKLLVSCSLVVSLFDYADVVYVLFLSAQLLQRIQRIQNSCLRFAFGIRKFDHITPAFERSGWLAMHQRYILHICCLTHSVLLHCSPSRLYSLLQTVADSRSASARDTRWQHLLAIPVHHTERFRAIFSYSAVKYYNILLANIRSETSLLSFLTRMENYIKLSGLA